MRGIRFWFSQFTSLLAILRSRLDASKIPYAYLDGRTRDREVPVEQFQNDPNLKLFLISLKAGGLGLNLYAAEYVYLLDPWWNPAVEAQAIDRAHRIGQTRQVFAYRLIARDTVEEKVLELQKTKRDLADAIITADNSLIHNLTRQTWSFCFPERSLKGLSSRILRLLLLIDTKTSSVRDLGQTAPHLKNSFG